MPERPLILFAQPAIAERETRQNFIKKPFTPSHSRQIDRMAPTFAELQRSFERGNAVITSSPNAIEPEYTLVFETVGDPSGFYGAILKLKKTYPNIEWVMELGDSCPNTDDFYMLDKEGNRDDSKSLSTKIFCVMTNLTALGEILSLWNHFRDPSYKFPRGLTGFRNLFSTLKSIHRWGIQERIEDTGILEAWQEELLNEECEFVKAQVELFFRSNAEKREKAEQRLYQMVENCGGIVLQKAIIPEIGYHAVLVSIPRAAAQQIINHEDVELISADEIMFMRASGQSINVSVHEENTETVTISRPTTIINEPIIALFDGVPQENHPLLEGLLSVDDPDDLSPTVSVSDRIHGSSMASLILRGQNMDQIQPTVHKLYVRPILKAQHDLYDNVDEYIPDDQLIVDKINECVRRLFEPSSGRVAPTVRIINLSIGIKTVEFYNLISPLARLLDWLSYKYRVLFIVSAGNHLDEIDLGTEFSAFSQMSIEEKDNVIAHYISNNIRGLRLLSPAESMNSLTIGSSFSDSHEGAQSPYLTLPCSNGFPAAYSSFGRGINNAIKPDLLYPGGRNFALESPSDRCFAKWRRSNTRAPGITSACPGIERGGIGTTSYSCGTSNSTALMSNKAQECYDVLNEVFVAETGDPIPYEYTAVLIKAMLTHGASWGRLNEQFKHSLNLSGNQANSNLHQYLGYGEADVDKVKVCAKNQVTLIGYGDIRQGEAFVYSLPLPFPFHEQRFKRRLTITLSYLSPIHVESSKYREKQVWFTIDNPNISGSRAEYDYNTVRRGTLQHEIFETDSVQMWAEDKSLAIKVNCRGDASEKTTTVEIPYALFATFELAPEYDIDVYQKVVEKVRILNPVVNITG